MDDRRRTISSEESMIGEGLMRVNNTLTAQRLTKSLSYQGGVHTRRVWRLILSLFSLFLMLCLLVAGGFLVFVLFRYEQAMLDTTGPFLKSLINAINTFFYASTEKATYKPLNKALTVEMLNQLMYFLNIKLGSIDFSPITGGISDLVGSVTGGVGGLVDVARSSVGSIGSSVSDLVGGLFGNLGTIDTTALTDATNGALQTAENITGALAGLTQGLG